MLALAAICLMGLVGLGSGCGGGGEETTSVTGSAGGAQDEAAAGDGESTAPLGPARPKESIEQAERRIAKALASGDCEAINGLNPLSRPGLSSQRRCAYLRRLDGLPVTGAQAYGKAGAVIDYRSGERTISAVLVLDRDGLYHVAFLNPFNARPSVGTPYAPGFDRAAKQAVEALQKGDCAAYLEVVFRRIGLGTADKQQVCAFADQNPIGTLLAAQPEADLERAGGNADYGFHTVSAPTVNFTIVLAREQDEGAPPSAPSLPKGAAKYGYVTAYLTNRSSAGQ